MTNENWILPELPKGWLWTDFESISRELKAGGTPLTKVKEYYDDGTIPFVKIEDIVDSSKYLYDTKTKITEQGLRNSSAWLVPRDSLLYSMYASYGEPIINKIEVTTSQAIIAYVPPEGRIVLDFVYYYLKKARNELTTRGTTQKNLNAQIVRRIPIPLAPFSEQVRIVARLEELFTRLDAGVEELRKVKAQLNRYRQAVLKYAFEGKLVPQDPHDEPVTELLKKTRAEKEELARERKIRKEKSPPPISEEEMPFEVPKGWVWVRLIDLIALEKNAMKRGPFGGSLKKEIFVKKGYLVYEQRHAIHNDFNYEKYFITPQKYEEMIAFKVESGDLIISCSGVTLGKISEIPKNARKGIINQALLKISLNNRLIRNDFFINFFNSDIYQKEIFEKAQGSAIPNMVGVDELKKTLIVVPPLKEQGRIVSAVNYHFSLISNANKIVESGVRQSNQLRQAILKVAFAGKLVSQNPNDEPAEKLLQRIKAERTSYWKSKIDNQLEMSRFVQ